MFIQKCQQNNAETVMIICFAQTIFKKNNNKIYRRRHNNGNRLKQGINEFL